MTYTVKQNKRIHSESETRKDCPRQGDNPSIGYEILTLIKEVFQTHAPFLHSPVGIKRLHAQSVAKVLMIVYYNIQIYRINTLYTLNLHAICQLYLNNFFKKDF